jgi:hypothetical protein
MLPTTTHDPSSLPSLLLRLLQSAGLPYRGLMLYPSARPPSPAHGLVYQTPPHTLPLTLAISSYSGVM